ncbi:MAG: Crp/Fnr family transcriptional regulator [Bacteriovoracaceae bacterium]
MIEFYERFEFPKHLERLGITPQVLTYNQGTTIYNEGEKSRGLYFIKEGLVSLITLSETGVETLLRIFSPCTFMGHRSLLAEEPYHATAVALKPTKLLFIDSQTAAQVIYQDKELMSHFLHVLAKDLKRAELRIKDSMSKRVSGRIIESLVFLKNRYPAHHWTRREIGEYCGAKTETVSRVLGELEKRSLIEKHGRDIIVTNEEALLALTHENNWD